MLVKKKDFQQCHLIGWQHSCQPIRSHVRKSLGRMSIVCVAPEGWVQMMKSEPKWSEGFDEIICPHPESASQQRAQATQSLFPSWHKTHHFRIFSDKFIWHGSLWIIIVTKVWPSCLWKSNECCHSLLRLTLWKLQNWGHSLFKWLQVHGYYLGA